MGCSVIPSLSLLETTWQADILQINKERLSVSCGIRRYIKQCVIAGYIVSVFFLAENPLRIPASTADIFVRLALRRFQVLYIH